MIGGILVTALVSKGIWESQMDMAFPQAVATLVGGVGASVVGWAVIMQVIRISDRIKNIESQLKNPEE